MVRATCDNCGRSTRAEDFYAGAEVECPACGATIRFPGGPPRKPEPPPPPPKPPTSQKHEPPPEVLVTPKRSMMWFVAGFEMMCGAMLASAIFGPILFLIGLAVLLAIGQELSAP